MVVQVSKKHSDTVFAFAQLGPTYMSPNTVEGERECKLFFPKGYDKPEVEEAEPEVKKKSKKRKKGPRPVEAEDEKQKTPEEGGELKETFIEGEEAGEGHDAPELAEDGEDGESIMDYEDGEDMGDEMPEEADKATSPMTDETTGDLHSEHTTEPIEGTPDTHE